MEYQHGICMAPVLMAMDPCRLAGHVIRIHGADPMDSKEMDPYDRTKGTRKEMENHNLLPQSLEAPSHCLAKAKQI